MLLQKKCYWCEERERYEDSVRTIAYLEGEQKGFFDGIRAMMMTLMTEFNINAREENFEKRVVVRIEKVKE